MRSVLFVSVFAITGMLGCKEKCKEIKDPGDCVCTTQYEPVCGCNNKTYSNACNASCAGVSDYTEGPCN